MKVNMSGKSPYVLRHFTKAMQTKETNAELKLMLSKSISAFQVIQQASRPR